MNQQITILLSTYNGERFLDQFLESLLTQTHENWLLITRDDGSTDATMDILMRFANNNPDKIQIMNDQRHLGAMQSFAALSEHYSDYTMFADQDDIWLSEKIAITLSQMKNLEHKHGINTPLLVHTDRTITNENLEIIQPRNKWQTQHELKKMLLQNSITGCTMMCNKALMNAALPIPDSAQMHDYWLALIASATGRICYISTSTVMYRQHANNAIGDYYSLLHKIMKARTLLARSHNQAVSVRSRTNFQSELLERFILLTKQPNLYNRIRLIKQGFGRNSLLENLAIILCGG